MLVVRLSAIHLILILTFLKGISQELPALEKKITYGEDGRVYINKDLGIYLWLSTSPDEGAKKYRLMSDSSKQFTNPMFLDTEGYNTVRSPSAVDTATKRLIYPTRDIIFEIYSDSRAPKTSLNFTSGNVKYLKGKKYYGNNVKAVLKAYDRGSGTLKTYYSINNDPFKEFKDTISFTTDGEKKLVYYSYDEVGNQEKQGETRFTVDNTAPEISFNIAGQSDKNSFPPNARIELKASDNTGVKGIYYTINNGKTRTYTSSKVPVKLLGPKDWVVSFWAVDYLGNTSEPKIIRGINNTIQSTEL